MAIVAVMRNTILLLWSLAACAGAGRADRVGHAAPKAAPRIEQVASPAEGILANAYLIDTPAGVIVVDAALRVSDAVALRARVDRLGKPLLGVLITHGHPDHYNGVAILTAGRQVPVAAAAGVDRVIRAHDAAKEAQWKPMFGVEWPEHRAFPSVILADGEAITLGGLALRVHAVGPAESDADSYWTIDGVPDVAFVGDLVFSGTHSYLSDGHTAAWLDVLAALERALPRDATLFPGHGKPGG